MIIAISAIVLILAAQPAFAGRRAGKPFVTVNGRTSTAVGSAARNTAASAPVAAQAPPVTNVMITGAPSDGGRSFIRRGRASSCARGRCAGGDAPPEEAPPHFSKPGALIRTTGQKPKYEKTKIRSHTIEAGEIRLEERKAFDVGRAPSLRQGPKDSYNAPTFGGGAAANSDDDAF